MGPAQWTEPRPNRNICDLGALVCMLNWCAAHLCMLVIHGRPVIGELCDSESRTLCQRKGGSIMAELGSTKGVIAQRPIKLLRLR